MPYMIVWHRCDRGLILFSRCVEPKSNKIINHIPTSTARSLRSIRSVHAHDPIFLAPQRPRCPPFGDDDEARIVSSLLFSSVVWTKRLLGLVGTEREQARASRAFLQLPATFPQAKRFRFPVSPTSHSRKECTFGVDGVPPTDIPLTKGPKDNIHGVWYRSFRF
jgi:hypothetical protein